MRSMLASTRVRSESRMCHSCGVSTQSWWSCRKATFYVCRAVRRPARVTDADTAGRWALLQVCHKIGDAAGPFPQVHVRAGQRRQAGAVVAAILEPAKAFDENWFRLFGTDVADDATHP